MIEKFRFKPRTKISGYPTRIDDLYSDDDDYESKLDAIKDSITKKQDLLFASRHYGVLAIFQGMDTSGKDGAIKNVFGSLNPLGVESAAFAAPSSEERKRDFLWRTHVRIPPRGKIGIFNRSYYEEVLTVRVNPELLMGQMLPSETSNRKTIWDDRFKDINNYESYLRNQGIRVIKFFLHLSKQEQKERLLARIDDPSKNWKFDPTDLRDRALWPKFMRVYEDCLSKTSTAHAPWYVIPADDKKNARLLTAMAFDDFLSDLPLRKPTVSAEQVRLLKRLRSSL